MLNDLKVMLGITEDDAAIDEKLNLIVSLVTARLKTLLVESSRLKAWSTSFLKLQSFGLIV